MDENEIPAQAAGWYADPRDADQQRYWDGSGWTRQTRPVPVVAPFEPAEVAASPPPEPPQIENTPRSDDQVTTAAPTSAVHNQQGWAAPVPVSHDPAPGWVADADPWATPDPTPIPASEPHGTGHKALIAAVVGIVIVAVGLGVGFAINQFLGGEGGQEAAELGDVAATSAESFDSEESIADEQPVSEDDASAGQIASSGASMPPLELAQQGPAGLLASGRGCLDVPETSERWSSSVQDGNLVWEYSVADPSDPPPGTLWLVARFEVLTAADLTGDGADELLVEASCSTGAGGSVQTVAVYGVRADELALLDVVHEGSVAFMYGDRMGRIQVEPGRMAVLRAEWGDGDPDVADVAELDLRWDAATERFERSLSSTASWAVEDVRDLPTFEGSPIGARDESSVRALGGFIMPSGNIACVELSDGSVACAMRSLLQPQPSPVADQRCTNFDLIRLTGTGSAQLGCDQEGQVPFSGLPVLDYEDTWEAASAAVSCVSAESGLSCFHDNGSGLFLSRAEWEAW